MATQQIKLRRRELILLRQTLAAALELEFPATVAIAIARNHALVEILVQPMVKSIAPSPEYETYLSTRKTVANQRFIDDDARIAALNEVDTYNKTVIDEYKKKVEAENAKLDTVMDCDLYLIDAESLRDCKLRPQLLLGLLPIVFDADSPPEKPKTRKTRR